jgi:hypothetical protein
LRAYQTCLKKFSKIPNILEVHRVVTSHVSHIQTLQPAEFAQGDALPVPVLDRLLDVDVIIVGLENEFDVAADRLARSGLDLAARRLKDRRFGPGEP